MVKENEIRKWKVETYLSVNVNGDTFIVTEMCNNFKVKIRYLKTGITKICEHNDIDTYTKVVK